MISNIEQALKDLRAGKLIVVLDDFDRENEGDLLGIADFMNPDNINEMITKAKGLLCAPIDLEIARRHGIHLVKQKNSDGTNFGYSIDSTSSKTGISAFERFDALKELAKTDAVSFKTPGHLFPLIAKPGGLRERRGHTEAAVDLAKLTGAKNNVGAIIEIIADNGEMLRGKELLDFCKNNNYTFITIEDLVKWIEKNRQDIWADKDSLEFIMTEETTIPTINGDYRMKVAKHITSNKKFIICYKSDTYLTNDINVRIHSMCMTSEIFNSTRCDCKKQLDLMLEKIINNDGLLIYDFQEGRNIGIFNKIRAYHLQDKGLDTVEANLKLGHQDDERSFDLHGKLLKHIGITKINLFTNNPKKIAEISKQGIKINRKSHWSTHDKNSKEYINTKKNKMNHIE